MNMKNALKLFGDKKVRTVWDDEQEKWYVSIVDVVGILTESPNANNYWKVLKNRLKKEGNQSVTNCNQLKMQSADGKFYKTDVADEWEQRGVKKGQEYASLTDLITHGWSGLTTKQYKQD